METGIVSSENANPAPDPVEPTSGENPSSDGDLDPAAKKIAELEAALQEEKNKYLYLYADFDNHKKRAIKERSDLMKFGWENIARDMAEVLDNLDRAVAHIPADAESAWKDGVQMTTNQLRSALEKHGVTRVASKDSAFNPELHDALGQEPSPAEAGTITQVLTEGYRQLRSGQGLSARFDKKFDKKRIAPTFKMRGRPTRFKDKTDSRRSIEQWAKSSVST
jgi:molecular chaperone GrpE